MRNFFTSGLIAVMGVALARTLFVTLGDRVDTWWGSVVAGFAMLPGAMLIVAANDLTKKLDDPEDQGDWVWLGALMAFVWFFYVARGFAILIGKAGPFERAIDVARPAIRWLFTFGVE